MASRDWKYGSKKDDPRCPKCDSRRVHESQYTNAAGEDKVLVWCHSCKRIYFKTLATGAMKSVSVDTGDMDIKEEMLLQLRALISDVESG